MLTLVTKRLYLIRFEALPLHTVFPEGQNTVLQTHTHTHTHTHKQMVSQITRFPTFFHYISLFHPRFSHMYTFFHAFMDVNMTWCEKV